MKRAALLLCTLLAMPAAAIDLDIGLGKTRWERTPNTQYWQQEFENSFDLISPAYYVGASDYIVRGSSDAWYDWGHDGIRWGAGWLDLGNMRSEAWATSDVNYKEGVGCINPCPQMGRWDVNSRIKGVELSVKPQWVVGGNTVSFKLGVLVHRPRIDVKIYRGPNDTSRTHFNYPEEINLAPSLGFGFERGNFWASLNYLRVDATTDTTEEDKRIPPGFGNNVVMALTGWSWK